MKRSIKSKLILTLASLITVALLMGGGLIIAQNIQQLREEIYLDALTFADLTIDDLVTSFEQFYVTDNFLQFRKVVNPLLGESVDIANIQLVGKSGELLYDNQTEKDVAYIGLERKHEYNIDRTRDIKASLLFSNGEIVFVKKNLAGGWQAVTANEDPREFPSGEVLNILYPHENARITAVYDVTYDALWGRILQMVLSIGGVIIASIGLVSAFAIYFANRLVEPLQELERGVLKVGKGNFGAQVKVQTDDEIGVLATNFNKMSRTLKKNTEELLEKEKLTKELDIARSIQQNMLPEKAPVLKGLEISGSLTAATQIGGDIYDYLQHDDRGAYIFIADVTGHGVPAGMVANITHSSLYSFSSVYEKTDEIMKSMNKVVHSKTQPNMFATALLSYWDETKKSLRFCNAGHEEMIYYEAQSGNIQLMGKGGMALGMAPNADKLMKEQEISLKSGDVLVFYTDGIPEAWKNKKENLGLQSFVEMTENIVTSEKSADAIRLKILEEVTKYRNGYPQQDDITLIVLRAK